MKIALNNLKSWNLVVLIAAFLFILFQVGGIYTVRSRWNPLLPDYTYYHAIGSQLNFLVCFVPVFVVGIILFLIKKHLVSIILLLVLLQISLLVKDHLTVYHIFYSL